MLSVSDQAYVFLTTVYAGFIIGFFYDCCRVIRIMIKAGVFVTALLDLLFWIIIGTLSFLVVFYVNDGNVRFFTIMGFVIGWVLYFLYMSRFVMKALLWLYEILAKAISWLTDIMLWPIRRLWAGALRLLPVLKKAWGRFTSVAGSKIRSIGKKTGKNAGE